MAFLIFSNMKLSGDYARQVHPHLGDRQHWLSVERSAWQVDTNVDYAVEQMRLRPAPGQNRHVDAADFSDAGPLTWGSCRICARPTTRDHPDITTSYGPVSPTAKRVQPIVVKGRCKFCQRSKLRFKPLEEKIFLSLRKCGVTCSSNSGDTTS